LSFSYGGDDPLYIIDEIPAGEWQFALQGDDRGEILFTDFILPTATWTPMPSATSTPTLTPTATGSPSATPTASLTPTASSTPTATPRPVLPPGMAADFTWGRPTLRPSIPGHEEPLELVIPATISNTVDSVTATAVLLIDGVTYSEIPLSHDGQTFRGSFNTVLCNRRWPLGCDFTIQVMATVNLKDGGGYDVPLGIQRHWTNRATALVLLLIFAVLIILFWMLPRIKKWFLERRLRRLQNQIENAKTLILTDGALSERQLNDIKEELSGLFNKEREDLDKLVMNINQEDHTQIALSVAYFDAILNKDKNEAFAWACQLADPHSSDNAKVAAGLCLYRLYERSKTEANYYDLFYDLMAEKRFNVAIMRHAAKASEAQ
jgi:hypothetical protein